MEFITKPWAHQKREVELIDREHRKFFALFYDMGTGKTKTAIDITRSIFNRHGRALKTLIICPLVVVENWKREYKLHSKVPMTTIQVIDGQTKIDGKKLKNPQLKLKLAQLNNEAASIIIINTEAVKDLPEYTKRKCPRTGKVTRTKNDWSGDPWYHIVKRGIEILIVDESHRFKSFNGPRTKGLHAFTLQKTLVYRYILTGSPVLQDALDLWAQFFILDPTILGFNYYSFRSKYFYDKNAGMPSHVHWPAYIPKDRPYYKALGLPYNDDVADLNKIIYKHAARVMKKDVLDLPPYTEQKIEIEMPKEQARIYKEMRDDLVATLKENKQYDRIEYPTVKSAQWVAKNYGTKTQLDAINNLLEGEVMAADLAIVKTLRLMQIACGIFVNEDGAVTLLKTNLEKELRLMLAEICSNKDNKVILWSVFIPSYEVLKKVCEDLGLKYVMLTGQQNKAEKDAAVDDFNNIENIQIMISNPAAGGTGVNLTRANYDIYYSWNYSLEHYLQSASRAYRGGQTRNYTSYKLVTPGTVNEKALIALEKKAANAEDILAVRKEFTRKEILDFI